MHKNGTFQQVHQLVDLHEKSHRNVLHVGKALDQCKRQVVRFGQQAQGKGRDRVVTPAVKERGKDGAVVVRIHRGGRQRSLVSGLVFFKAVGERRSQIVEFRRRQENQIECLHHGADELVCGRLVLSVVALREFVGRQCVRNSNVDGLGVEQHTKLSYDQRAACFEELPVLGKEIQNGIQHELELRFFRFFL